MSRFERQLPVFGEEGQMRIMGSKVGIAGCGGLGVNVITQLAVAGRLLAAGLFLGGRSALAAGGGLGGFAAAAGRQAKDHGAGQEKC